LSEVQLLRVPLLINLCPFRSCKITWATVRKSVQHGPLETPNALTGKVEIHGIDTLSNDIASCVTFTHAKFL